MGQAKKRRGEIIPVGTSLKDRRRATVLGVGCAAGSSLAQVAIEAGKAEDRQRYHANKERARQEKAKKRSGNRYAWDFYDEQDRREKKQYGASAAGVTYKHHANIQKINKGRKF